MKSKVIAISAISAGFTAICLTLGAYIEMIDLLTLILSSVFVILPLYYNSYKGAFLCYLAGGVIAFLFSGFNIYSVVVPAYFLFFGIYPIIRAVSEKKKLNKYVWWVIGLIWCVLTTYGIYFYYIKVMNIEFNDFPDWLWFFNDYADYLVGLLGIVFFFVFDRFIFVTRKVTDYYLAKIIK